MSATPPIPAITPGERARSDRSLRRLLAILLFSVAAAGCGKAKVGAPCSDPQKGTCKDGRTAILCVEGAYREIACGGVTGCMTMGIPLGVTQIACADDRGDVGEGCVRNDAGACSTDNKQMLVCKDHVWTLRMACSGPRGCVQNVREVSCDGAESKEGDPCEKDGFYSCSPDKQLLLGCQGGKMRVASTCRGQNHCQIQGDHLKCDTGLAAIGDACDREGRLSCDEGKKIQLRCSAGKVVKDKHCHHRCTPFFDEIHCE